MKIYIYCTYYGQHDHSGSHCLFKSNGTVVGLLYPKSPFKYFSIVCHYACFSTHANTLWIISKTLFLFVLIYIRHRVVAHKISIVQLILTSKRVTGMQYCLHIMEHAARGNSHFPTCGACTINFDSVRREIVGWWSSDLGECRMDVCARWQSAVDRNCLRHVRVTPSDRYAHNVALLTSLVRRP